MTLTIQREEDDQRQIKVTVGVAEERVQKEMQKAARRLARDVNIPGFRRGKAPYNVILGRVGEPALRAEAVESLLDPVFSEMLAELAEADIYPYAQPSLDDMESDPLSFEFTVPLEPVVELGDYRAVRKTVEPVEVTDEAVSEALEHLRTHHAVLEPVDRPIMSGDLVTLAGTGEVVEDDEVQVIFDEERIELVMDPDETFPGTSFVDNLIGLEIGDDAEFTITLPDEDEEEGGKEAQFNVSVLDVQSRYLPELDDELAQQEGDYESLEELETALREQLQTQAEADQRQTLFEEMLEAMLEDGKMVYPPAAVEDELGEMVESLQQRVEQGGWQWQDYLRLQGETEESVRDELREQAEDSVRRRLALGEFIRSEYLYVKEEELEADIDKRLGQFGEEEEVRSQLREFMSQGPGRNQIASGLLMEKVMDRVAEIVTGAAPDLEALKEEFESKLDDEEE